jgi:hypothetical protein
VGSEEDGSGSSTGHVVSCLEVIKYYRTSEGLKSREK